LSLTFEQEKSPPDAPAVNQEPTEDSTKEQ
jgi:hypothetical protein